MNNVICKCNICQNEIKYTTGKDEYPACATLYYCKKDIGKIIIMK